jgi:GNAT superfamily N-acetyltransferase/DNA-directed RNA polymerase subunit RPC12/RpoP
MALLDGTERFGSGTPTTVDAPAVDCPSCAATVFTEKIGVVSCDDCGEEFRAEGYDVVSCPAVECDECGEKISFIQEHRSTRGPFDTYHCHNCSTDIALQTPSGVQSTERVLETNWLLKGRTLYEAWNSFGDGYWWTRAKTDREQTAVDSLNIEAQRTHPSFNAYVPGSTNAHLCGTDDYCVGYITWEETREEPELGQLYILPAFRRQGIGAGFVEAWREDVADSSSRFRVNNPNADMYRLLRSIGAVEITEDGLDFTGCIITGSKIDVPDEWGPDMA